MDAPHRNTVFRNQSSFSMTIDDMGRKRFELNPTGAAHTRITDHPNTA